MRVDGESEARGALPPLPPTSNTSTCSLEFKRPPK
ncbi:hypothetical protein ACP70R_014575 [Stipagrostis hirtigluma subsp. patula]